jgi:hypothetical protein
MVALSPYTKWKYIAGASIPASLSMLLAVDSWISPKVEISHEVSISDITFDVDMELVFL